MFKAWQWNDNVIFMVNILDIYNVYLLKVPPPSNGNNQLMVLSPIQKIKKHGQTQITAFFDFGDRIYCLLAANYLDENRFTSIATTKQTFK